MEKLRKDVREVGWFARLAAVLAAAALVVALVGSATSFLVARRDATHAKNLAKAVAFNANAKRDILHASDIRGCRRDHRFAVTFTTYLEKSIARSKKLLRTPGALANLSPQVIANSKASVREAQRFKVKLRMADCDPTDPRDVLPLNPKKETP